MKKIVLLSDGTGNNAAKRHKTNVWRLYNALDLQRNNQIAMYDDGVGSQQFLPLKLLGGAFGWGLKRNVIELYEFLCRNYVAGDRIYLFGFSRGAFTVRVLAGLIDECGLCTNVLSKRQLHTAARANYAIYRERYKGFWLCKYPRIICKLFSCVIRGCNRPASNSAVRPRIAFIGVWDTVDAVSLPVDQLAKLLDRFVYRMGFPDKRLSCRVQKACHAVSIDDERQTFHPVLWDERREQPESKRIEQVWFPGVHGDVGGGFPRHDLALVSLDWMMSKVEANGGLKFLRPLRKEYRRRCDWMGIQHDSRAGLGSWYRYKPRNIDELCKIAGVRGDGTNPPKLHRSVFERIREGVVPYAPTGIPASYDIVTTLGTRAFNFETDAQKDARIVAMNDALDVIYWRQWLYRAFVATTLLLVASPVLVAWADQAPCANLVCHLDSVGGFVKCVLPDFVICWVAALCQNLQWFFAYLAILILYLSLIALKCIAFACTFEKAARAWSVVKGSQIPPRTTVTTWLRTISDGALGRATRCAWWVIVLVVSMALIALAFDRMLFHVRDCAGWLCGPLSSTEAQPVTGQAEIAFDAVEPCLTTGLELAAGTTCRFDVEVLSGWMDGDLLAEPDGLVSTAPLKMKIWIPLRRHMSRRWFELTGRVGRIGR